MLTLPEIEQPNSLVSSTEDTDTPPLAVVAGQAIFTWPQDLYIPPQALQIFLEAFEGPLDLLLYLIKRNNLDILNIPIAEITRQYMVYVELMREMNFTLAAEYLVMAAMLAEIKSRLLLPRPTDAEQSEDDPRVELIRRLQEYERFKKAAQQLDELPQLGRDFYPVKTQTPEFESLKVLPEVQMKELLTALMSVMERVRLNKHHEIRLDNLSVRERMTKILQMVSQHKFVEFHQLFDLTEGRLGVVVTFLAMLELLKQVLIEIVQVEPFSPIHIRTSEQTLCNPSN